MPILILETSCDETAAAVVDQELRVLGSVVASQDQLHAKFQGVVPEIAARAHVERILPVIDETLHRARLTWPSIEAIAVVTQPGLVGSLLIGLTAAKTLALVLDKPLVAVDHLQAHIYACRLGAGRDVFPCLGLVVSGGHTSLYRCRTALEFELLGGTIDDAAGEAFDKVAKLLGLGYPGGPAVARRAESGRRDAHAFPRAFLQDADRLQFSFSGLKTAVRYTVVRPGQPWPETLDLSPQALADICASFQEAVIDCLVGKALQALRITGLPRLCVGGGVAANQRLRRRLAEALEGGGVELLFAPAALCTDNAVMGAIAVERLRAGLVESLELDITPGLVRN